MQMRILISRMVMDDEKWKISESKLADRRHIENRFPAISQRHIVPSMRNLEWGSSKPITCWCMSRDKNGEFLKFKMADDCHFKTGYMSAVNCPISVKFGVQMRSLTRRMLHEQFAILGLGRVSAVGKAARSMPTHFIHKLTGLLVLWTQ